MIIKVNLNIVNQKDVSLSDVISVKNCKRHRNSRITIK